VLGECSGAEKGVGEAASGSGGTCWSGVSCNGVHSDFAEVMMHASGVAHEAHIFGVWSICGLVQLVCATARQRRQWWGSQQGMESMVTWCFIFQMDLQCCLAAERLLVLG
jgi:hypothetical protein